MKTRALSALLTYGRLRVCGYRERCDYHGFEHLERNGEYYGDL